MTIPVSNTIFASRDAIRTQVVDFLQQYMELDEVDLTQSSFLSYIIDILTSLSSNLMFYQSSIYKEFFLTQAQLPESIHNLSSFLGYSPKEAKYAVSTVLMTINLPFNDPDTQFNIPNGFEFKTSDGINFVTYYSLTIKLTNNTSVNITAEKDGKIFEIPYNIDTTSEDSNFQFILPLRQFKSSIQEFQLDDDLQPYQFTDINVPIEGKVSDVTVYVRDPNDSTESTGRLYEKFNSLYLMSSSDYGYVLRVSPEGRKIYFGNGIIGQQPLPGSTIVVHINETEGVDGNVIAGSITTGSRIYSQQHGATEIVDYDIINTSPAYNGTDQEDLQQIRSNSIKSLVSLNRLVSEQDYQNFDIVVPNAPIKTNSIPVLKRSDLKINEIQLFTIFNFLNEMVPSRNVTHTISTGTTYIPREITINKDGIDYITLFEMTIDGQNDAAFYHYIMKQLELFPTLIETWTYTNQDIYHFNLNELEITAEDSTSTALFELSYYSNEVDFSNCTCEMKIVSTDEVFTMTNVPGTGGGKFTYLFSNYLDIPMGNQTYYFTIENLYTPEPTIAEPVPTPYMQLNSQYSAEFTFRRDLKSYMISNTFSDGTSTIIYDIPVIQKEYYDSINQRDFESQVLQLFINTAEFKNYRMLTDFINIKLCNTTGLSTNMLLNEPNKDTVVDIGQITIPSSPNLADRYIVTGVEGGEWNNHRDHTALCIDATANIWTFIEPTSNDIVYITNKGSNYIYTEYGWVPPIYNIPLKIVIEVFKINDSSIEESNLIADIKSVIIDYYKSMFGPKLDLRRSKVIDLVHNVNGVSHCRLLEPKSNIFFNYDIDKFTQQELLEYTPEWMYFKEEDITIKLFTME